MQGPYAFAPVALSSLERCAFYLNKDIGQGRVDGVDDDTPEQRRTRQAIRGWLYDISMAIQQHCRREFLIQARTQYFDNVRESQEFFPTAVPILSIAGLEWNVSGVWDPAEDDTTAIDATAYAISEHGRSFFLRYGGYGGRNALRLNTYLGGLAYHGTQSVYTVSGVTGAGNIIPGRFAYGMTSEAMGKVVAFNSMTGALTLDVFTGVFTALESLVFQTARNAQDMPATGATVASIDRQSLCEAHPDIARAVEIELRYCEKHENDFEIQTDGSPKSGASRRQRLPKDTPANLLQDESAARLAPYVRYLQGA